MCNEAGQISNCVYIHLSDPMVLPPDSLLPDVSKMPPQSFDVDGKAAPTESSPKIWGDLSMINRGIESLKPGNWLNDEAVNFAIHQLMYCTGIVDGIVDGIVGFILVSLIIC
ncbi:hypothetical protein F4680DRAFT_288829 [Xylaria scruposa]|nr:hypothetical protein F4680DRAFT_288829 [Xylaria scruposa]